MEGEVQLAIIVLIVLLVALWMFFTYHQLPSTNSNTTQKQQVGDALSKMQRLWTERSYLMRMNNVEKSVGYLGHSVTAEKFMQNAHQIGRNFGNLYGQANGNQFASLLTEHNNIMDKASEDAMHHKDIGPEIDKLKENNKQIISFLLTVNPRFDQATLQRLFDAQVDQFLRTTFHTIRDQPTAAMAAFDSFNKVTQDIIDYLDNQSWKHIIGISPRY